MNYTTLGRAGVKISPLTLGTMNFGPWQDEPPSYTVMDRALELGLNFWDTANVYGFDKGRGLTEEIIGRWMAQGGRRDKIVLATKLYGKMGDGVNDGGNSAYNIRRAVEASLKRMQTDHIDLIQMHHIDRSTPWEEAWQAFDQLITEGKITYVGSSNFAAWNIAMANERAAQRHMLGLVAEQSVYSLRNRHIELEVIPASKAYNMAVIPWSPLAGGLLCGIYSETDTVRRKRPQLLESAEKLRRKLNQYVLKERKNVLLSDELFATPQVINLTHSILQQTLARAERPLAVISVVAYRRFHDWLISHYKFSVQSSSLLRK